MADVRSVRMSEDERSEFLGRGGTGIISFDTPDDDPPYSRPVSYGYDAETGNFYFRFAVGPDDAGKTDIVDEDRVISFVTYEQTDSGWRSVIATGRLEEITKSALDPSVAEVMERITIPFVDVYDSHPLTLEFRFFRLTPDDVTGKQEAGTAD
jgi:nitroimidazol reductase NimA-like FMN-containing flavoprotein (pyridoxamine 5'-phosphate oxidase superfamily)